MDVHPTKNVSIGIDPYPVEFPLKIQKTLYLMVKTMVSCRFSLKPIQWSRDFGNPLESPEAKLEKALAAPSAPAASVAAAVQAVLPAPAPTQHSLEEIVPGLSWRSKG